MSEFTFEFGLLSCIPDKLQLSGPLKVCGPLQLSKSVKASEQFPASISSIFGSSSKISPSSNSLRSFFATAELYSPSSEFLLRDRNREMSPNDSSAIFLFDIFVE